MTEKKQNASQVHSDAATPEGLADPTKHRQGQVFEEDNRPMAGDETRTEPGHAGEASDPAVGNSPGSDTSGAVAPPAERNKPGASTRLGGTPGANATRSPGKDTVE